MKKVLLVLSVMFCIVTNAQTINIPDINFKNKLLQPYVALGANEEFILVDANGDGEIQQSEALQVHKLLLFQSNISNLTGIEYFTNLRNLQCHANQITELNLQQLTLLEELSCSSNPLSTLNLSGMSNMKYLGCAQCQLTELNLGGLVNLEELECSGNNLTTLDLSDLTSLRIFGSVLTPYTALDVSALTSLEHLTLGEHFLTSVDLSALQNLISFTSTTSAIEFIDVSNNPNLLYLQCQNNANLEYVLMKNGNNYNETNGWVMLFSNPSLQMVCADEGEISSLISHFAENNMNVNVNSFCTAAPGGDYNTIAGNITFDADENGCGGNDDVVNYIKVNIDNGTDTGATYTGLNGSYNFYVQEGSFTITPEFLNNWFTVTPGSAIVTAASVNNNVFTNNFCITPNGVHPDVEVVLLPLGTAQPGFDALYKIVYKNKGNQTLSGAITLNYNDALTDLIMASPVQTAYSTGQLTWDYSNLQPFETRNIIITLNVNSPQETPAVNIGDELEFGVYITPTANDETPADNQFGLKHTVTGSFDPNDITCLEGDIAAPDVIGEYLHYNINFENTGNAAATFIVVEDVIDASQYDINTLQVLDASHSVVTTVTGNKVVYRFDNINLGGGEKGNVVFKIKTLNTLQVNDDVTQKANIFFDYNWPIETNEATTVFASLNTGNFTMDASVKIYPNPSNGMVNISAVNSINSFELYDMQGRLLQFSIINDTAARLDISQRSSGMYFVKVKTEKGIKVEKIVKE